MKNTERKILALIQREQSWGVTITSLVKSLWPESKQPLKKCKTVHRYIVSLIDSGRVTQLGGASSFLYTEARFVYRDRTAAWPQNRLQLVGFLPTPKGTHEQ